ncbi:MAG: tyrosine-type recombinase/integrase [Desulfomicrobium sp.]|nr:tyrosine-type recombinase/integrase [Desulfomicrobium sp.]
MAIKSYTNKSGKITHRVYFKHPYTKKQVNIQIDDLNKAKKIDSQFKHMVKFEKEAFYMDDHHKKHLNIEIADDEKENKEELTIGKALDYYSSHNEESRKESEKSRVNNLKKHFGIFIISNIKRSDLVKYTDERTKDDIVDGKIVKKGVSLKTIKRELNILRTAIAVFLERNDDDLFHKLVELMECPVFTYLTDKSKGKNAKNSEKSKIEFLSNDEKSNLYENSPDHLKIAILLADELGVRFGPCELFKMKHSNVDYDNSLITIERSKKDDVNIISTRTVEISQFLRDKLKESKEKDIEFCKIQGIEKHTDYIVNYKNQEVSTLKRSFKTAMEKSNIKKRFVPYNFRHMRITYLLYKGIDCHSIANFIGHSDPQMILKFYSQITTERMSEIRRLNDHTPYQRFDNE